MHRRGRAESKGDDPALGPVLEPVPLVHLANGGGADSDLCGVDSLEEGDIEEAQEGWPCHDKGLAIIVLDDEAALGE